jgi:hypothetical protein
MPTADELKKQKDQADKMKQEADRAARDQKDLLRRHGTEIDRQIAALQEEKRRNDAEIAKL